MILQTAALLTALGLIAFTLGSVSDHPGIAMIGAIVVIGVGASAMTGGVMVAAGSDTHTEVVVEQRAAEDISDSAHVQTVDVADQDGSPTGLAFIDGGGGVFMSGAQTASVYKYNTSDWGLGAITYASSHNVSTQDSDPAGVSVGHGSSLFIVGAETTSLYKYDIQSYNLSTASLNQSLDISARLTAPEAVEFRGDGTRMYLVDSNEAEVHEYALGEPFNLSTASHTDVFDVSAQAASPTGLSFSAGGERMLVSDAQSVAFHQYALGVPGAVASASYTGNSLNASVEAGTVDGVEYEDEGRRILAPDEQSGALVEYDSSVEVEDEKREERTHYKDIETATGFPVGVVVLGLGAVMLLSGTGEASEQDLEMEDDNS